MSFLGVLIPEIQENQELGKYENGIFSPRFIQSTRKRLCT